MGFNGTRLTGFAATQQALEGLVSDAKLEAIVQRCAEYGEAEATENAPVDSGTLQGSITSAPDTADNSKWYFGTHVRYGWFVEMGTRVWEGVPYLRMAAAKLRAHISDIAGDILSI